jgi:hypothetical protein
MGKRTKPGFYAGELPDPPHAEFSPSEPDLTVSTYA